MILKKYNKKPVLLLFVYVLLLLNSCIEKSNYKAFNHDYSDNLKNAMELVDSAFLHFFETDDMKMARFYNPFTNIKSKETGSVWMYTAAIESVNNILKSLQTYRDNGSVELYNKNYEKYLSILYNLYDNLDYYKGTFTLTSYTQTKEWSIYGVHRSSVANQANVKGIENVYDDQMWLVRELMQSFKITEDDKFLDHAEYLTAYVLDGWDCTIDENGDERGGIPWGPGYVSKHACSNGPMISPLVWLHEYYSDKTEEIEYRYIDVDDRVTRRSENINKNDYYLQFAEKIYDWQKKELLRSDGVYDDMMGGCAPGNPTLEIIDNVEYRVGISCLDRIGPAISYNSGTMISGASDLFRATNDSKYYNDAKSLVNSSFSYFAKQNDELDGYYSYKTDGFNNWFNGVLLRSYIDYYYLNDDVINMIHTFQDNLDYGCENYIYKGLLPHNILIGWDSNSDNSNIEGMFMFSFAAMFAELSIIDFQ